MAVTSEQKDAKSKKGFTLIELVIVITLLGILAATALPKFANLTQSAYTAANQGIGGAFTSAVNITHATYLALGLTVATRIALECNTATPTVSGNIYMSAAGWPVNAIGNSNPPACSTVNPPQNLIGPPVPTECKAVWDNIQDNPPLSDALNSCITIPGVCYVVSVPSGSFNCLYTYTNNNGTLLNPSRTILYNTLTGSVVVSNP